MNENKLLKIIVYILFCIIGLWWLFLVWKLIVDIDFTQNNQNQMAPIMQQEMKIINQTGSNFQSNTEMFNNSWTIKSKDDYSSQQWLTEAQRELWVPRLNIHEENIIEWEEKLPE